MCGIVAILRRPTDRRPPATDEVLGLLEPVPALLAGAPAGHELAAALDGAARRVGEADTLLRGTPGVRTLLAAPALVVSVDRILAEVDETLATLEAGLDTGGVVDDVTALEAVNRAVVRLKDASWAVRHDRLRTARAVADLAGPAPGGAAVEALTSVQQALSAIDRLEVRGRDSAGLHLLVRGHDLDLTAPATEALLRGRVDQPLFTSQAVRTPEGHLSFVYKAAAEIGELGDNTAAIRAAIRSDELLHLALSAEGAGVGVVGHTRWASVGIVSEANAHPLDSGEQGREPGPYVTAVLNGDVDNFADLQADDDLAIAAEITTDAKVIPTLISRQRAAGTETAEAFRRTVARLEGSVAIAAATATEPHQLLLALRGSGQALYVGLADDLYVVASEPYGVVEDAERYLRLDGETPADPENPTASRGQIVVLDGAQAGTLDGIRRLAYDGTPLPVGPHDLHVAEITTRDIDRGAFPHYFVKEVGEAPASFRKTLRGKIRDHDGHLVADVGGALPDPLRLALRAGEIRRIVAIGQGTTAVAAQSLARALATNLAGAGIDVEATHGTELSGFGLADDMADTLVVAISQSGTTSDTNRTVDLVRSRGARVVSIVNRRGSDLTDKSDGVLYTSDGRDVEMSVASTKAFYAQVAAGFLLAAAVAEEVDAGGPDGRADRAELLAGLREVPDALAATFATRPHIAEVARRFAPSQRHWSVVGNGANRVAAAELRIKLSELCYKSIGCDATEDKKHIDLSSEPLILVCAAGLSGSTADDVAKEVAIFRAHSATPLVIATEGEERFGAALAVLTVPAVHPALAFVLGVMAGHLFGYEAALAIDAQAQALREVRASIEETLAIPGATADGDLLLATLAPVLAPAATRFADALRAGDHDGHLEASTAVRLASQLRYAVGVAPLDSYQIEHGRVGTPAVVIEDLAAALGRAIEELTRPVDAIKHQAKTVTVGISRSDETLLQVPFVREALAAGAPRDRLSYRALRTLANLDPAVEEVLGYTRYLVDGSPHEEATVTVVDRGGISRQLPLRTERDPRLRGTKHRAAVEREVTAAVGHDGRTIVIVPEAKGDQVTGITLLQVRFADRLSAASARTVLGGYRNRYSALSDAVTESEPTFRDDLLASMPLVELLTEPVYVLARHWRGAT